MAARKKGKAVPPPPPLPPAPSADRKLKLGKAVQVKLHAAIDTLSNRKSKTSQAVAPPPPVAANPSMEVNAMDDENKQASGEGKNKFHLVCAYHADLPEYDTNEAALEGAYDHMKKQHADSNGRVAENAEVMIVPYLHVTAADAKAAEKKSKPKNE